MISGAEPEPDDHQSAAVRPAVASDISAAQAAAIREGWTPPDAAHAQPVYSCSCWVTDNIFVQHGELQAHYVYESATQFDRDYRAELCDAGGDACADAVHALARAEWGRRSAEQAEKAERCRLVAAGYVPRAPGLFRLSPHWLHASFAAASAQAREVYLARYPPAARAECAALRASLPAVAEGVYRLSCFSEAFCSALVAECEHFEASGLPRGRPNTMNRHGVLRPMRAHSRGTQPLGARPGPQPTRGLRTTSNVLYDAQPCANDRAGAGLNLDELGFSAGFTDRLLAEHLGPLAAALYPDFWPQVRPAGHRLAEG
jgi:hypothetical protein